MAAPASTEEILDVNRRYHDVAAADYDSKWGVDFGAVGRAQVLGKVEKLLGRDPGPFARVARDRRRDRLLHAQPDAGGRDRRRASARTSRPGCSTRCAPTPSGSGSTVETVACDAAALPFEDASFDLVLGHAVLHHLPELERSFAEFMRVLRPGGVLLFAGEPSRHGDRIAALPEARRARRRPALAPCGAARARRPSRQRRRRPTTTRSRRSSTCTRSRPPSSSATPAAAGFAGVRVRGEELLANMFGWFNRTVEASAVHDDIPRGWFRYAYRGYILLQKVDAALLEPHLPAAGFYNLMLTARKP